MKHLLITLMLLGIALPISAQRGLHINEVFEGNVIQKAGMHKTLIKGESLEPYKLTVLHTAKFTAGSLLRDKVEALFSKDMGEHPSDKDNIELEYRDGHLYYAVVQIDDTRGGLHRYICYQCRSNAATNNITLAYMEGKATLADLRKTFKRK
ncbi:MAG: hypothetical protein K2O17_06630 [Bacteroidaceae bacterium]|nr:hypothetical protein [Bacteroidaceae bacterium]